MKPFTDITDPKVAKALAHPLRMKILTALEQRTASPSEIADEVGAPLTNVSYHVRHLHRLGVIKLVRRAVKGGTVQHYYRTEVRPQIAEEAWGEIPEVVRQALVGATLQQLAEQVNTAAAAGGFVRAEASLTHTSLALDAQGWKEAADELHAVRERLEEVRRRSEERVQAGDSLEAQPAAAVLLLFEASGAPDGAVDGDRSPRQASRRRGRERA